MVISMMTTITHWVWFWLFGGTPPTSTFRGGDSLPRRILIPSSISHIGHPPYVSPNVYNGPSFTLGYNPIRNHALGFPLHSGGIYPGG